MEIPSEFIRENRGIAESKMPNGACTQQPPRSASRTSWFLLSHKAAMSDIRHELLSAPVQPPLRSTYSPRASVTAASENAVFRLLRMAL
jgi:hypothetical protein